MTHSSAAPPQKSSLSFSRAPLLDIIQFTVLILLLGGYLLYSAGKIDYQWDWGEIPQYLFYKSGDSWHAGPLIQGLIVTIKISVAGLLGAFFVGLSTALLRRTKSPVAIFFANLYLELSRNTPLLIQIFFIYFVLGPILGINRFFSAVLALCFFDGAYAAEIFRSGIESVDEGQYEAAQTLGLSKWATYRHIVIPQALRKIMPPLTSQSISLVKDSALVSTIAIYDLTLEAQRVIAETYLSFEIWFVVALLYLFITLNLSLLVGFLEKRFKL